MEGAFQVNGRAQRWNFEPDATLLQVLRENGYTEVKNGCSAGECGACLILLDEMPVNSCQVLAATAIGRRVVTVAGVGDIHFPHVIQSALADTGAVQCGFCTPGMILAAYALLKDSPDPTDDEIKRALDGNLCRCTGYVKVITGVQLAAKRMRENG